MGKIRHNRRKYHLTSSSSDNNSNKNVNSVEIDTLTPTSEQIENLKLLDIPGGLFKDIDIDVDKLKNNLDNRSTISKKSLKNDDKRMTKKEKLKLRRELFLKKMNIANTAKIPKKQATIVVSDLPCEPSSSISVSSNVNPNRSKSQKPRMCKTFKQRKRDTLNDIKSFKRALQNSDLFDANKI